MKAFLDVGTWNVNARNLRQHPDRVFDEIVDALGPGEDQVDVLVLQEMGGPQGQAVLNRLMRAGHGVWRAPRHPGAPSTPIVWRKGMKVRLKGCKQLTPRTFVGLQGAGASPWLNPKWLLWVRFDFAGRIITVTNLHGVSSVYIPKRAMLARRLYSEAAEHLEAMPAQVIAPGDYNTHPSSPLRRPFRAAGYRSTQLKFGALFTFRRGPKRLKPDDQLYRSPNGSLAPVGHRTIKTSSDHDIYVVRYLVNAR